MPLVDLTFTTSALVDGQPIDANDPLVPFAEIEQTLEDILNGVQRFARVSLGPAEALTIASGAISPTQSHVVVDTEGAASTDDLVTINNGSDGRTMSLRIASASRQVVLKHGTGNIRLASGNDYTIASVDTYVALLHNGTNWIAVPVESNQYLSYGLDSTKTIASDAITKDRVRHVVDTEGAASADNLATINGGVEGDYLELVAANVARVVTVKHNTGNIKLAVGAPSVGADRVLDVDKPLTLRYNGTHWVEQMSALVLSDLLNLTGNPMSASALQLPPRAFRRTTTASVDQVALDYLPGLGSRKFWREQAAAATYAAIGMAAGTTIGAGAVTNANDNADTYVSHAIAATGGTFGGRRTTTFDLTRRSHFPIFEAIIRTGGDITNIRFWIGLFQTTPTNVDTLAAGTAACAFRYSTVAADTGWMAICNDGTNQSTAVQVAAIAANTRYRMKIVVDDGGSVHFSINDGAAVTVTSNLPATGQDLGAVVTAITTTASAKVMVISSYGCVTG